MLGPVACSVLCTSSVVNFKRVLCVCMQGIGCLFVVRLCCAVPDYGFSLCVSLWVHEMCWCLGALDLLEVESSIHLLWEGGPELCKPTVLYLGP